MAVKKAALDVETVVSILFHEAEPYHAI